MTSKILYEVITFLCCYICVASIQDPFNIYFGNHTDWNLAWKTCEVNKTRLPNVKLSELGLQLADIIHRSPNECFWIGATYARITNYTYGKYPTFCCGTMTKDKNNFVRACDNCETRVQFVCESGPNTVSDYKPTNIYLPWINASRECSERGLLLPSVNNTMFLGRVRGSAWWIHEARNLNLSPMTAKNDDLPICFCDAASMNFKCSANVKTYCIPYTRSNISTTATLQESMIYTDVSSTEPIATITSTTPSRKSSQPREFSYEAPNRLTHLPQISGESLNEKSHSTPKIGTRFQSVPSTTIVNIGTTGNRTLVGSLIGASVTVIVILSIGIIVILKRKRTKRKAKDDIHYKTHTTAKSNKKFQPQANSSYGIVSDDPLDMDPTSKDLPRIQTVPQQAELHTEPQSVKQISINNKDDQICVNNNEPPLYSMVQKGQIEKDTSEVFEECYDNNKEYDKIEFEKRYVSESSGDMYDKANMHCREFYV